MDEKLLNTSMRSIPAEHFTVLSPQAIEDTVKQLFYIDQEIQNAADHRETVDNNKAELVQQKTQLETAVKLTEAEAFMHVYGEGKEQYGLIGDKKIVLNNDTNRDAYRRSYSAAERKELAEICGEINAIDVDLDRANDMLRAVLERSHIVAARAGLQAALLNYLARRE
jgi:hypothetical protein